jgi:hypothetical protein
MGQLYPGAGNKLEAAKQAIQSTNDVISGWGNGSHFGLITYRGGQNGVGSPPTYEVFTTNELAFRPFWGGLTNNITTFNNELSPLSANGSTPTYHALDFSEGEMLLDNSNGRTPIFILLTDGVPTISSERYSFNDADVQAVPIKNPDGTFRSAADVRVDGGAGGAPGYFNGEPLADMMEEIDSIKSNHPDYIYHAIGIQGNGNNTFNSEILEYVAFAGGGIFADPSDLTALSESLEQAVQDSACTTQSAVTQLANFKTTSNEAGHEVLVTWDTVTEVNTEGFNLYSTTDSNAVREPNRNALDPSLYEKLNDELIPSKAGPNGEGASYEWLVQGLDPNTTYYFLLEEVKKEGTTTTYEEEVDPSEINILFLPLLQSQ